jgi:formate-dependent nitrite reductase cytochrome c552 subunit
LAFVYWADWGVSAVKQPIEFPHKTHIAQNIPCTGCHQRAEKDLVAGRPPTALCLACHASGDSKSAEITKLKAFGDKGQDIPWRRVWRLPSHVFFSHRVHVSIAKLACQSCHGPMETLDRPPPRPLKTLAMEDCIACHMKSKANAVSKIDAAHSVNVSAQRLVNDCVNCHR